MADSGFPARWPGHSQYRRNAQPCLAVCSNRSEGCTLVSTSGATLYFILASRLTELETLGCDILSPRLNRAEARRAAVPKFAEAFSPHPPNPMDLDVAVLTELAPVQRDAATICKGRQPRKVPAHVLRFASALLEDRGQHETTTDGHFGYALLRLRQRLLRARRQRHVGFDRAHTGLRFDNTGHRTSPIVGRWGVLFTPSIPT